MRGMPVLTWTVRSREDRARAAEHADQIIYEARRDERRAGFRADRRPASPRSRRRIGTAAPASADPFLSHAFLSALEDSGSAVAATGWRPLPIAIDGTDARPAAVMPAYLKSHSLGEYVFDHGWADAYERAGGAYYPKLQIAVPFTPVPGRRLLARDPGAGAGADRGGRADRRGERPVLGPRHLHRAGGGRRCSARPAG